MKVSNPEYAGAVHVGRGQLPPAFKQVVYSPGLPLKDAPAST